MIRYFLDLTFSVFLLALLTVSAQAQTQEKPAEKSAVAPTAQSPFDAFQRFSATLNGGLGRDTNRKIYRSGKLMRFEFPDHYRIADMEAKSVWLMYPKRCSKFPMLDPGVFPFSRKFRVEQSSTSESKETVDGHTCKIEDMALLSYEDPAHTTFKMKLYRAEDLSGFPLRIDVENPMNHAKFTITYSDVSLEPPDAKLFERPAKCNSSILTPLTQPGSKPKPAKPAAKAPPKPAPKPE
jgi:outer membrane lipoprotein-sorting protein